MTRVEESLAHVLKTVDSQSEAIVRVHERIDEFDAKLTSGIEDLHKRISNSVRDFEKAIDAHSQDEEKINSLRFGAISKEVAANFTIVQAALKEIQESGKERADNIVHLRNAVWKLLLGLGAAGMSLVGFFGSYFLNHPEKLIKIGEALK